MFNSGAIQDAEQLRDQNASSICTFCLSSLFVVSLSKRKLLNHPDFESEKEFRCTHIVISQIVLYKKCTRLNLWRMD